MKKKSGAGPGIVVVIIIVIIYLSIFASKSKYDKDLKNGLEKYHTGQDMSESEYDAVKNYNDNKDKNTGKNTEKTYDEWDN